MNKQKLCIGIDVSKDTLDIYWNSRSYKISNTESSISRFIKREIEPLQPAELLCVMESTGGYERNAVRTFISHKIPVHIAHSTKINAFAKVCDHFAKTDKLDAILIHKYAEFIKDEVKGDMVYDEVQHRIGDLRRLIKTYEESLHAAKCRIKQMDCICTGYIDEDITYYETRIAELQAKLVKEIDSDPTLKKKKEIMITMKGVKEKSATTLLAELPEIGTLSRRQIVNLVGLAPKTHQSGKKNMKAHISKGRFYARKAIYMPALTAIVHEPIWKEKYEYLLSKTKAKKVALVAIMREMIIALNAMLKKSQNCNYYA